MWACKIVLVTLPSFIWICWKISLNRYPACLRLLSTGFCKKSASREWNPARCSQQTWLGNNFVNCYCSVVFSVTVLLNSNLTFEILLHTKGFLNPVSQSTWIFVVPAPDQILHGVFRLPWHQVDTVPSIFTCLFEHAVPGVVHCCPLDSILQPPGSRCCLDS